MAQQIQNTISHTPVSDSVGQCSAAVFFAVTSPEDDVGGKLDGPEEWVSEDVRVRSGFECDSPNQQEISTLAKIGAATDNFMVSTSELSEFLPLTQEDPCPI